MTFIKTKDRECQEVDLMKIGEEVMDLILMLLLLKGTDNAN